VEYGEGGKKEVRRGKKQRRGKRGKGGGGKRRWGGSGKRNDVVGYVEQERCQGEAGGGWGVEKGMGNKTKIERK